MEGWCTCLAELGISEDNPTWTKAVLAPVSPASYSPMILLGFDEEKYVKWPDEDKDIQESILARDMAPTNEASNHVEGAGEAIAEVSRERFVEETGEDASRDPPPEL